MQYVASGNAGAANITAATSGIIKVDNPAASTMAAAKIYEIVIGPQGSSADNIYGVRAKRQSTAGTWTAVTPSPLDAKAGASVTTAGVAQTAQGTPGVELGRWGFHMRGGMREQFIPGGELIVPLVFSNGIEMEYVFSQSTDILSGTIYFNE